MEFDTVEQVVHHFASKATKRAISLGEIRFKDVTFNAAKLFQERLKHKYIQVKKDKMAPGNQDLNHAINDIWDVSPYLFFFVSFLCFGPC